MLLSSIQLSQRGLSPRSISIESLFEILKSKSGHSTHSKINQYRHSAIIITK